VAASKTAGINAPQAEWVARLSDRLTRLMAVRGDLDQSLHRVEAAGSEEQKAELFAQAVSAKMLEMRMAVDELEGLVADELWPLPKYREMLFLS
jgi:glutamine synthetase